MTHAAVLAGVDPAGYGKHALHSAERIWPQKNCYVDLWIELLHAQGMEPCAMLPFAFALDFEDDQWTFFKPPLSDLRRLYGIDVQELTVWQPLLDHALEHLRGGKLLSVEVDSWWLPDTAGIDYREAHSKTTIVINEVDARAQRLGYFHNDGYFSLDGEDFAAIFALDGKPAVLPPYAELIRVDRAVVRDAPTLRRMSRDLLEEQLRWRAPHNPIARFAERLDGDVMALREAGMERYHKWAFAGLRQFGAASELCAEYLCWQWGRDTLAGPVESFERLAQLAKTVMMKVARAISSGRDPGASELLHEMAAEWDAVMNATVHALNQTR